MSRQNTTIQINSLEALERLIGGDSELELSLRHSVVAAFAKHHLKELATLPVMSTAVNELRGEVIKETKRQTEAELGKFTNTGYWTDRVSLAPDLIDAIKKKVREEGASAYADAHAKFIAPHLDEIEGRIAKRIERAVEERVNKNFNERVDAAVRARIDAIKAGL